MKSILILCLVAAGILAVGCSDSEVQDVTKLPSVPIAPLPECPPGSAITISWTEDGAGSGLEFLAQRSPSANFDASTEQSGWSSGDIWEFTGLADGVTQYFRVKIRDDQGNESAYSDPVFSTPDSSPPESILEELAAEQTSLRFDLYFQSIDSGSGVQATELWVSREGGDFVLYESSAESPVRFVAEEGGQHEFMTIASDEMGNRELVTGSEQGTQVPEPILIVDRTGKEWDITNAALRYGMISDRWGHGLGQNSIPPVLEPRMLERGDPSYPRDDEGFEIMGVAVGEDARGYRIGDLMNREVADDVVGDQPIAVTY